MEESLQTKELREILFNWEIREYYFAISHFGIEIYVSYLEGKEGGWHWCVLYNKYGEFECISESEDIFESIIEACADAEKKVKKHLKYEGEDGWRWCRE